ncbi:Crp/Fnr family transcriptional regulator [Sabulibacter ruber]|uniref:Crp/Fnr family transcriptional regulator n=1 Tax=Sabulibacter ruber TaxID=2811901 RepID=UPI001A970523|nr:Crp/Fnr family transcriptional regulator [Sabulibacter ruber]
MEELAEQLARRGLRVFPGREALAKAFTKVWFRKGQLLLVPGQTAQSLYFLSRGLVRGYRRYERYEATTWFLPGGQFLLPDGCFTGEPGGEYIECLEDSVGFALSLREAGQRMAEIPQVASFFLRLLEEKALEAKRREEMLRIPAAADRYRHVLHAQPTVVYQATQELLASYLNLSPKHLSRLRREEARGGRRGD